MQSLKLAVKATLEAFADFVTAQAGVKLDKNQKPILDEKTGKPIPVNSRGNLSFAFEGITFDNDEEAAKYCADHNIVLREVLSAAINDAKGLAVRTAVGEVSKTIPETEVVNATTLADWTNKAQEAANTAASKVVAPEISSRAVRAGLEASISSVEEAVKGGQTLSDAEKDAFIQNVLALRGL